MPWIILAIVGFFAYRSYASGSSSSSGAGCKSCMGKMGVTGILSSLFGTPEQADAGSPTPAAAAAPAPSAFDPLDLSEQFSLSAPAGGPVDSGAIAGEGTYLEYAAPGKPAAGFGTAQSPGGNLLKFLHFATSRPGEPGGPAYFNRPQSVISAKARNVPASKSRAISATDGELPAAVGRARGAAVAVSATKGGTANGAIAGDPSFHPEWKPTDFEIPVSPWEAGIYDLAKPSPLPTLSTHPGIPIANAPAHRPAAASTPHVVSSAMSPAAVAGRTVAAHAAAAHHEARVETHAAMPATRATPARPGVRGAIPATPARGATRGATPARPARPARVMFPARKAPPAKQAKPAKSASRRPIVSRALPIFRAPLGYRT